MTSNPASSLRGGALQAISASPAILITHCRTVSLDGGPVVWVPVPFPRPHYRVLAFWTGFPDC